MHALIVTSQNDCMKHVVCILVACIMLFSTSIAQKEIAYAKLGASMKFLLAQQKPVSPFLRIVNGRQMVAVQLETTPNTSAVALRKQGYQIRTVMGSVATADIPLSQILDLAALPMIKRIELPLIFEKTADTVMRRLTTVEQVLQGAAPLDKAYTGRNVLLGVIDDGVDFSHPDFYDADGNLRISYLWNMDNNNGQHPQGFNYGTEWPKDSLVRYAQLYKRNLYTGYEMENRFGYTFHGTSVTSLAAGNSGVATGATIVDVALTAFTDTIIKSDRIIDAIAYIYNKAQQLDKRCVINISLGSQYGGPHDGKTLVEKAIDNFCNLHNNVLVCVSAGNNGNDWKHWGGFPIDADSSFGMFKVAYSASLYVCVPRQYSKTLQLALSESKADTKGFDSTLNSPYYQTPYLSIDSLIQLDHPVEFTSYLPNRQLSAFLTITAAHANDDYDEIIITPNEQTSGNGPVFDEHIYRYIFKGIGTVHVWYPFWNLHPIYYFGANPFPDNPSYHNTDNEYSTIIPTNGFTVLSSGAYNLRTCYVNMKQQVVNGYEKCRTTYFTSHGPTLDGRIKPDIISPGENVLAARSRFQNYYDYEFIIDTNTVAFGGTSAASPISAGIAALLWEKYPDDTREQIIARIKSTADFDAASANWGPQPNNIAGWGKIDAFNAMAGVRINKTDLCNGSDVCSTNIPVDTIPNYNNYYFIIYPNPVHHTATINYKSSAAVTYYIYDALGRLMQKKSLPYAPFAQTAQLNVYNYPAGIYFIKIADGKTISTQKIMVSNK